MIESIVHNYIIDLDERQLTILKETVSGELRSYRVYLRNTNSDINRAYYGAMVDIMQAMLNDVAQTLEDVRASNR